jgi:hypothetical protein
MHGQDVFSPNVVAQAQCIGVVPGGAFNLSASAVAKPGTLAAAISVDLSNVTFTDQFFVGADGFAAFSDTLTFSSTPPGSKAAFTFDVGGIGGAAMHDIHGIEQRVDPPVGGGRTHKLVTYNEVVTPGLPLAIDFSLDVPYELFSLRPDPSFAYNIHYVGDFTDPANLVAVQLLDASGTPIPNVGITSASGFDYSNLSPSPVAVGEPPAFASAWLAASLLWVLLTRRRGPEPGTPPPNAYAYAATGYGTQAEQASAEQG